MKRLILSDGPVGLCKIRLIDANLPVDSGKEVSWRIDTGRRAMVINGRLHSVTKKLWMFGNISEGATYACDSEEMFLMLTDLMGPCDQEPTVMVDKPLPSDILQQPVWPQIVAGVCWNILIVLGGVLKMLAVLIAVPFVILFFGKRK